MGYYIVLDHGSAYQMMKVDILTPYQVRKVLIFNALSAHRWFVTSDMCNDFDTQLFANVIHFEESMTRTDHTDRTPLRCAGATVIVPITIGGTWSAGDGLFCECKYLLSSPSI